MRGKRTPGMVIRWGCGDPFWAQPRFGRAVELRGGSFNNNRDNARGAYRNNNEPGERNNNIGFRSAKTGQAGRLRFTDRRRVRGHVQTVRPAPGRRSRTKSQVSGGGPGFRLAAGSRSVWIARAAGPLQAGVVLIDLSDRAGRSND